eukprot:g1583.t1
MEGRGGRGGGGRSRRRGAHVSFALGDALGSFAGLALAALAAVFVVGVLLAMYDFNYGLAPNECIEFPENPLYTELTMRSAAAPGSPEDGARRNVPGRVRPGDRVGSSFFEGEVGTAGRYNAYADDPPYRLVHVFPQGAVSLHRALTEGEIWGARAVARGRGDDHSARADRSDIPLPVLFVPGHGGSYNQSKASAAQAVVEHLSASSQSVRLNFFALDFLEVPSGLDAELIWSQARYINRAIRHILAKYAEHHRQNHPPSALPTSVLLLAHSMGGLAARAAPFMKNHLPGSINGIVTLNSPHQAHPFGAEGGFTGLYLRLNELWSSQSSWNGSSGLDEGAPDNVGVGDRGVLSGIVVVSITGGSRDHVVRADLTSMRGLAPKGRALHVWTTALPGVWVETDHDAIVWCGQLVAVLSRALANMHERIVEGGQHGGFRVIPDPLDRLQAFKESLFGRSQKHWHLPQMKPLLVPDALRRGVSMVEDAEKARAARARSTIIPRSDSYSFVGEKKKRPTDGASTTEGSICVPFSANRDRTKSMAVLTDMAPFRQVRISVCSTFMVSATAAI